jgi:hypothetical protein
LVNWRLRLMGRSWLGVRPSLRDMRTL